MHGLCSVNLLREGTALSSKRENTIGVVYLFMAAACWSFIAVVVKQLTATVDPNTISFFRVFLATLVFVALFVKQKGDWRRLAWFAPLIVIGALGRAGNYLFYNAGLVHTPSSAATILAPVQQIGVVILAGWFLNERIASKWLGMTLSFLGLLLIWWNGQPLSVLLAPDYAWGYSLLVAGRACQCRPVHIAEETLEPLFRFGNPVADLCAGHSYYSPFRLVVRWIQPWLRCPHLGAPALSGHRAYRRGLYLHRRRLQTLRLLVRHGDPEYRRLFYARLVLPSPARKCGSHDGRRRLSWAGRGHRRDPK